MKHLHDVNLSVVEVFFGEGQGLVARDRLFIFSKRSNPKAFEHGWPFLSQTYNPNQIFCIFCDEKLINV